VLLGLVIRLWLGAHQFSGEVVEADAGGVLFDPEDHSLSNSFCWLFGLGLPAKIAFGH